MTAKQLRRLEADLLGFCIWLEGDEPTFDAKWIRHVLTVIRMMATLVESQEAKLTP